MRTKLRVTGQPRGNPAGLHALGSRQVRIIGGQWKRTPLAVINAEGLRPTPDRVRETVFNWLHHLLEGRWENLSCLDLFAGTGALGYEAASRGAAQVIMVESNAQAVKQLEAVKGKLDANQVEIMRADALAIANEMARQKRRFDLVFLDPPYHQGWLEKLLPIAQNILADGALIYAEAEYSLENALISSGFESWEILRADKAGMVFFGLLKSKNMPEFKA